MNLLKKIQTFVNQSDLNFWIVIGASAGLFVVVLVTCFYCLSFRRRRRRRCSARNNKHLSVKDDHHTFYECREPSSRLATEITITDNYNQDDVSTIGEPSVFVVGYDDNMNAVRVGQCSGSEQQQQQQQHHTMFLTKQQQSSRGVLPKNVRSSRRVQSSSSSRVEGYSHYPANFLNEPRSVGPQKKYAEIEVTTTTTDRPAAAAAAQNVSSLSGIVSEKRQQGDRNHHHHDHRHHANNNGLGHESVWNGNNNHPVHTRESLIFAVDHDDEEAPSEPEYYGESAQTPESSSVLLFTYDDDDDDNSDDDEEPSYQNQQRRRSHHASLVFGGSGMQTMTTTTRDLSTFTYDEDVSDDDAVYHDEELAFSQPAAF